MIVHREMEFVLLVQILANSLCLHHTNAFGKA